MELNHRLGSSARSVVLNRAIGWCSPSQILNQIVSEVDDLVDHRPHEKWTSKDLELCLARGNRSQLRQSRRSRRGRPTHIVGLPLRRVLIIRPFDE